ncbi:hypothetical protein [Helicobacter sp. MIT 01-3238]|uniref:hypothetical protein n=1 Tax=Helicobacter sp. MIT 01-3238 TaxID=398627 RepID=UPI000E1F5E5C|nr:hypothetical protein [Helicobacter sp. MIT 01-3238]RDU52191.1 hypothetical protein CQA40_08160 [Helicobacter sp. MIT 01-3238]
MQNHEPFCPYLSKTPDKCGGCEIDAPYPAQLASKKERILEIFGKDLNCVDFRVFASPEVGYRARAEFRIYRKNTANQVATAKNLAQMDLAMMSKQKTTKANPQKNLADKNQTNKSIKIPIKSCPILLPNISLALKSFIDLINDLARSENKQDYEVLSNKLYAIEALGVANPPLSTKTTNDLDSAPKNSHSVILTLIYHKKLDKKWEQKAKELSQKLPQNLALIGRSKNQKITLQTDKLLESITLEKTYIFLRSEGRFSQPNAYINPLMINFVKDAIKSHKKEDLLELYCGEGNFCVSLASEFRSVLATEVVKSSIPALRENAQNNDIANITALRLSGEESIEALEGKREFFRAREVDLKSFRFSHILIDPPRSGISGSNISQSEISGSEISSSAPNTNQTNNKTNTKNAIKNPLQKAREMLDFIAKHDYIIYISCNPLSLKNDLEILLQTHKITHFGLFDQFPHTHHIESALILKKHQK